MNNYVRSFAVSFGLSAVLGSSRILAQSGTRELATVPFAFHAKNITLPAGKYAVGVVNPQGTMMISELATGHAVMVMTRNRQSGKSGDPRLTFHRYGNEYFLSEIWMPDQVDGYKLSESTHEKELAKQPGQIALATIRFQSE